MILRTVKLPNLDVNQKYKAINHKERWDKICDFLFNIYYYLYNKSNIH